jgi:hypothetical protein
MQAKLPPLGFWIFFTVPGLIPLASLKNNHLCKGNIPIFYNLLARQWDLFYPPAEGEEGFLAYLQAKGG